MNAPPKTTDWTVGVLGDIADVVMGQSPPGTSYNADRIGSPLINGPTEFTTNYPIAKQWTTAPVRFCRPEDVLICVRGSSTGRMNVANSTYCIGRGVAAVRARGQNDQGFVRYALAAVAEQLLRLQSGSTFPSIDARVIRAAEIDIPLPTEQHAVAEALTDADDAITTLELLIAEKEAIKLGVMQQLLSGNTRLPGFTADWHPRRIGDFAHVTAGGTPLTSVARYWGGHIRWMSSGELHQKRVMEVVGRISEAGLKESSAQLLPAGSVLIGLAGQGKTRGTVAICKVELATNQSIAGILPSPEHCPAFLYYNLEGRYDELRSVSTGGSGRGGLNLTIIRSVPVLMPDVPEQEAIADVLGSIDDELALRKARLRKAQAIKQGMMQELLTGRTRLPVMLAAAA